MGNALPRLSDIPGKTPEALGMPFVRLVKALILAKGDLMSALVVAERRWPHEQTLHATLRSAVNFGSLTGSTWGSGLADYQTLASGFVAALRGASVAQQLRATRVPFQTRMARATGTTSASFVGEGKPTPISEMNFDSVEVPQAKVVGMSVVSQELAKSADPAAEGVLKADLIQSIAALIDTKLLDPASIAVANVSPASLTSGTTAVTSSGSTALLIASDLESVMDRIITAGGLLVDPVWIAKPWVLAKLAAKMSTTGSPAFPNVRLNGTGTLLGIPVVASPSAAGSTSGGNTIVLIDQSELLWAQDGLEVSVSGEAALQMDSAPSANAAQQVSLWQNDLLAIRVQCFVNWLPRRSAGITAAYLDGLAV